MVKSDENSMIFNLGNGKIRMKDIKLNQRQPLEDKGLPKCYSIGSNSKKTKTINL